MSEYQYYEFRTINRQLPAAERTAADKLSSHGHRESTTFTRRLESIRTKYSRRSALIQALRHL